MSAARPDQVLADVLAAMDEAGLEVTLLGGSAVVTCSGASRRLQRALDEASVGPTG